MLQEAMVVTCMQREGQAVEALAPSSIKSFSGTDTLVGFNEVGFAKHIHYIGRVENIEIENKSMG